MDIVKVNNMQSAMICWLTVSVTFSDLVTATLPAARQAFCAFGYYVGGSSPLAELLACVVTKLQSLGHITNEVPIHLVDASGKAKCSLVEGKVLPIATGTSR
eukprot:762715-Hanusia_phi.AAC.1